MIGSGLWRFYRGRIWCGGTELSAAVFSISTDNQLSFYPSCLISLFMLRLEYRISELVLRLDSSSEIEKFHLQLT